MRRRLCRVRGRVLLLLFEPRGRMTSGRQLRVTDRKQLRAILVSIQLPERSHGYTSALS